MNNAERLKILNNTGRTVFSSKNLQDLWQSNPTSTKVNAKRMVDKGLLIKLAKGYFALNDDFNFFELANLIISPSYVSLNSALFYHGVCFQVSDNVSSVALLNYEKKVRKLKFKFFSMKEELFFNLAGVNYKKNLSMASSERAVLDCFYFGIQPNIDNFDKLNQRYLRELAVFYPKKVQQKINKLFIYFY